MMSWTGGIALYFIVWWLTLFAVLPLGVRSQHEDGDVQSGTDPGAPVLPGMGRKLIITTVAAIPVCALLWAFLTLVDF